MQTRRGFFARLAGIAALAPAIAIFVPSRSAASTVDEAAKLRLLEETNRQVLLAKSGRIYSQDGCSWADLDTGEYQIGGPGDGDKNRGWGIIGHPRRDRGAGWTGLG